MAYDPCYHATCDALRNMGLTAEQAAVYAALGAEYPLVGNINMLALEQNIDAIAHSLITFAYSTEAVNGVIGSNGKGKAKIKRAVGGGQHGAGGAGSGGLHDHGHLLPRPSTQRPDVRGRRRGGVRASLDTDDRRRVAPPTHPPPATRPQANRVQARAVVRAGSARAGCTACSSAKHTGFLSPVLCPPARPSRSGRPVLRHAPGHLGSVIA